MPNGAILLIYCFSYYYFYDQYTLAEFSVEKAFQLSTYQLSIVNYQLLYSEFLFILQVLAHEDDLGDNQED